MAQATDVQRALQKLSSPTRAAISRGFFKTGPGQYAEGDIFIGVTVPQIRTLAVTCELTLAEILKLLRSPIHEARLLAVILLVKAFASGDERLRKAVYRAYLTNIHKYINNWDLIDTSAEYIVGAYLADESKAPLVQLAKSTSVWERRVAMIATYHYIKQGSSQEALRIAKLLVNDQHDLIQKAVGWMLREVGKRCAREDEEKFLEKYAATMPRTMLRYALEHFPKERKNYFMGMKAKYEKIISA